MFTTTQKPATKKVKQLDATDLQIEREIYKILNSDKNHLISDDEDEEFAKLHMNDETYWI